MCDIKILSKQLLCFDGGFNQFGTLKEYTVVVIRF
jgi:hypothetical protein